MPPSGSNPHDASAPLLEVFASYQGEGLFVGQPQTFFATGWVPPAVSLLRHKALMARCRSWR